MSIQQIVEPEMDSNASRNGHSSDVEPVRRRNVPGALSKHGYDVTGAVIEDLEQDRVDAEHRVRERKAEVQREKEAHKLQTNEELDRLNRQITAIQDRLVNINADEAKLREEMKLADAQAKEEAEAAALARKPRLDQLDSDIQTQKDALAERLLQDALALDSMEEAVHQQQEKAAEAYANAGLRPRQDESLRIPDMQPEWVAIEDARVLDDADKKPVPAGISWPVTVVSGIAAGFSLGLAAHFFYPETIRRNAVLAALFSLFGIATSIALKYGMESLWREVSLRLHLRKKWMGAAVVASLLTLLVITIYSNVEKRGLMSAMTADIVTAGVRDNKPVDVAQLQMAATFGSLFLTVPYCLLISMAGFRMGRHIVHRHSAGALRSRQQQETEEAQRKSPVVQAAFRESAVATVFEERIGKHTAKREAAVEKMRSEIGALELERKSLLEAAAPVTPSQQQLLAEQYRLATEKASLNTEVATIEAQKRELSKQTPGDTPAEKKLKAAEDQLRLIEARISFEVEKARRQIEAMDGNLFQRLARALKKPKPNVGTQEYRLHDHEGSEVS